MRIVHVVKSLEPSDGGLPVVPVRLGAAQAALGHEVQLFAVRDAAAEANPPELFRGVPDAEAIRCCWLPHAGAADFLGRGPVSKTLARDISTADVAHLHGIWEPLQAGAAHAARKADCPYVIAAHGMLDPWSLAQRKWKKRFALAAIWRRLLNGAAALHFLNADEAELVTPLKLTAPAAIIPNGVCLEEADEIAAADDFAAAFPALRGKAYVLFLSRLHVKKGLDILAEAFPAVATRHPELHLVVAGPDDGARADFERRIAAIDIRNRVHLVGSLHGTTKWAALRAAACFCLPSRQEGFSMAILEALASRTPVVITDGCHFPEVKDAGAGEVVAIDATAISQALLRVLDDPSAREHMGAAGRKLVEDRFTWRRAAERSIEVYGQIIR